MARSAVVMISAPPPSEITQQSSLCSGSAIMRELTTSSAVIGSRYIAFGLSPANSRTPAAISPSCSIVVPYSCMCRWAAIAYAPTSELPYGASYACGPPTFCVPRANPPVPSMRPMRDSWSDP